MNDLYGKGVGNWQESYLFHLRRRTIFFCDNDYYCIAIYQNHLIKPPLSRRSAFSLFNNHPKPTNKENREQPQCFISTAVWICACVNEAPVHALIRKSNIDIEFHCQRCEWNAIFLVSMKKTTGRSLPCHPSKKPPQKKVMAVGVQADNNKYSQNLASRWPNLSRQRVNQLI